MQYGDAVVVLEGMIKSLESHIELAKKGLIQEDCIGCREKDLETYKGLLQVLEKEHDDKEGWHRLSMEWQFEASKLNQVLDIVKRQIFIDGYRICTPSYEWELTKEEYALLKREFKLCPDSKIAK